MDDLISRQAAIDALIKMLSDCFYADEEVLDAVKTTLNELPPAQPEPQESKTGEWIHDGSHWANRWICDRCKYKLFGAKTKFCPDCGQRMEVDNEV